MRKKRSKNRTVKSGVASQTLYNQGKSDAESGRQKYHSIKGGNFTCNAYESGWSIGISKFEFIERYKSSTILDKIKRKIRSYN